MNRRTFVSAGTVVGISLLAGCPGNDTEPAETPTPPQTPPAENGELVVTAEPSAESIVYGEEYTVTITVRNDGAADAFHAGSIMARAEAQAWTALRYTEGVRISAGEELSETYTFAPPTIGDIEFGYMDGDTQAILSRWNLSVATPRAGFGETNGFYDGLAVTADLTFDDELDMPIRRTVGDDPGTRTITAPVGRQWVTAEFRLENTNETDSIRFERVGHRSRFFLTANGTQQRQYDSRIGWGDAEFEDQFTIHEYADISGMAGYLDPPSELVPGGAAEGWLLFTAPDDATSETVELSLTRFEESAWNDVRVYWTGV